MTIRIIPRLDIKGPNLVKGIHLEGLRVLGKPWDFAQTYYREGADELIYIDVVASLYGRNNLLDIVRKTAQNVFIPFTVGGGIRSLEDIRSLLRSGADKVAINTGAVYCPDLIRQGAEAFGSQCIVSHIEAKRMHGRYEAMTDNGREASGKDAVQWAKQAVSLGAGEILLVSIDREGTGKGYDLELIRSISKAVPVPVIASGGAGNAAHALEVISAGRGDAICAASLFHYHYVGSRVDTSSYAAEGNIEFIKQTRGCLEFMADRLQRMSIPGLKAEMVSAGLDCRAYQESSIHG